MHNSWDDQPQTRYRHKARHRRARVRGRHRRAGGCWRHAAVGLVWVASVAILAVYC